MPAGLPHRLDVVLFACKLEVVNVDREEKMFRSVDKKACGMLRSLLQGKAFVQSLDDHSGRKWINIEVLKHWRILPAELEDSCRRVKWLQSMVGNPGANIQVRAALFGSCLGRTLFW